MELSTTAEMLLEQAKPRLERALVAAFGVDSGLDAAAMALSVGWQRREQLVGMENPVGYLFTVGRNHVRRRSRTVPLQLPPVPESRIPEIEPGLPQALASLTEKQRTATVLIHCFDFTYAEASEVLDVSVSTLRNHLARGLEKLRSELGVSEQ